LGLPAAAHFGLSRLILVAVAQESRRRQHSREGPVSFIGSIIDGETTAGLPAASPLGLLSTLLLTNP
jgi:hypothetical protein